MVSPKNKDARKQLRRSRILAILGPSGAGKTTIRGHLKTLDSRYSNVVAMTTRQDRATDPDRFCVTDSEFDQAFCRSEFLPANEVYGARYATPKDPIYDALHNGFFPLLDWPLNQLDILYHEFEGNIFSVYLLPPSIAELKLRLSLDDRDKGANRLHAGSEELAGYYSHTNRKFVDLELVVPTDEAKNSAATIHSAFLSMLEAQDPAASKVSSSNERTFRIRRDRFYRARGGTSQVLHISCSRCENYIFHYQKDGQGNLYRFYLDRAVDLNAPDSRSFNISSDSGHLVCSNCKCLIGLRTVYAPENRSAWTIRQGSIRKQPVKGES